MINAFDIENAIAKASIEAYDRGVADGIRYEQQRAANFKLMTTNARDVTNAIIVTSRKNEGKKNAEASEGVVDGVHEGK